MSGIYFKVFYFHQTSPTLLPIVDAFEVGAKVEARYNGDDEYFSCVIAKMGLDGTYDIDYDDGDNKKTGVKKELIRLIGSVI